MARQDISQIYGLPATFYWQNIQVRSPEYQSEFTDADEAVESWGVASIGLDPLVASFTLEPNSPSRPHVPFYRFFHYPDVLDLRSNGFEVDHFIPLFDALENARYSQALQIHYLLHYRSGNPLWNPRRAREFEFVIRAALHRHGRSEVPTLLRRMLGRAFPEDSLNPLAIDLLNVFFWATLAQVARDYAWKDSGLELCAEYLEYPLKLTKLLPLSKKDAA